MYTVSRKKVPTFKLYATLSNLNRLRFDKVTEVLNVETFLRHSVYVSVFLTVCLMFSSELSWLSFSYKSGQNAVYVNGMSVWVLTRVKQIVAATHADLNFCVHRPTNGPW